MRISDWSSDVCSSDLLALKQELYVEAARAIGARMPRILFHHILPNCVSPLIVQASMDMGMAILSAASLGFIGLGAKPPSPEWGAMISVARPSMPARRSEERTVGKECVSRRGSRWTLDHYNNNTTRQKDIE